MDALREWMRHDPPPGELLIKAAEFGAELERDPETDAELEHANFFMRVIPGTEHAGRIVAITFTLEGRPTAEFAGQVRCQDVTCIRHPERELVPVWPAPKHH